MIYHASTPHRGSVLIMVIWITLGLVTMTLILGHTMKISLRGSDNDLAGTQAQEAIEGGARYAIELLSNPEVRGRIPASDTYSAEEVPVGEAYFWFIGRSDLSTATDTPTFAMIDEGSKINLNTAPLELFERLPTIPPELSGAILDWRDTDEELSPNGAESSTYLAMKPSRNCKNAPFESVDEMLQLYGCTESILYGEDLNQNGILDANENDAEKNNPSDNANGILDFGLFDDLTVFTREPNVRADGTPRLNVNGESAVLATYFEAQIGASRAQAIMGATKGKKDFKSLFEFFVETGMTAEEFDLCWKDLTIKSDPYLKGLINVFTANERVLTTIPGIDTEGASKIIAARSGKSSFDTGIAWVIDTLGKEKALLAGPYLTGQSWQATIDIAAVGRYGRGYRRTRFVIDFSQSPPQIVYRQNLTRLGWALGTQVRNHLLQKQETKS